MQHKLGNDEEITSFKKTLRNIEVNNTCTRKTDNKIRNNNNNNTR